MGRAFPPPLFFIFFSLTQLDNYSNLYLSILVRHHHHQFTMKQRQEGEDRTNYLILLRDRLHEIKKRESRALELYHKTMEEARPVLQYCEHCEAQSSSSCLPVLQLPSAHVCHTLQEKRDALSHIKSAHDRYRELYRLHTFYNILHREASKQGQQCDRRTFSHLYNVVSKSKLKVELTQILLDFHSWTEKTTRYSRLSLKNSELGEQQQPHHLIAKNHTV